MNIAVLALAILWLALISYAVLGGADFGAGIWDLLALLVLSGQYRVY